MYINANGNNTTICSRYSFVNVMLRLKIHNHNHVQSNIIKIIFLPSPNKTLFGSENVAGLIILTVLVSTKKELLFLFGEKVAGLMTNAFLRPLATVPSVDFVGEKTAGFIKVPVFFKALFKENTGSEGSEWYLVL